MHISVSEGDEVNAGTVLGFMESTANQNDVVSFSKNLDTISSIVARNQDALLINSFDKNNLQLGELQPNYQTFQQAFLSYKNYLSGGFYLKKKAMLENDMNNILALHQNLLQQKNIQQQDLSLAQKTFDANDTLEKQKVISQLEYRNEKSKLLAKQMSLPQIDASIIANENQQNDKQKEIADLNNTIAQQKSIFIEALNTFKSEVDDWKKKYLLIAPINGKVVFANFFQENQQLQVNQLICFINPGDSKYYAEINIPQENFGKVKTGEEVLLKFPAYPDAEFGSVKASIDFISHVPTDSGYLAKLRLDNGLQTNYNKQIQYKEGLIASGEIITKNMRLLQRFYYSLFNEVRR